VTGIPAYMSPEQARGGEAGPGSDDLYPLGCPMHELLTGAPPFPGSGWPVLARHSGCRTAAGADGGGRCGARSQCCGRRRRDTAGSRPGQSFVAAGCADWTREYITERCCLCRRMRLLATSASSVLRTT
jgi:hypothetical protein